MLDRSDVDAGRLIPLLRQIGRGAAGARPLAADDARALFGAMLDGVIPDLELGAVLMAYRIKGETPEELAAMLDAAHARCLALHAPAGSALPVVIPSYNGARKQPNLVPLLAALAAREGAGRTVLVHGVREFDGRVTTDALFRALGWPVANSASQAQAVIDDATARRLPAMIPVDVLAPGLARLLALRARIGLRSSGHTIAKLLQPFADADGVHRPALALRLVSYTHPEYREALIDLFRRAPAPALIARGTEGEAVADARRLHPIAWLGDPPPAADGGAPADDAWPPLAAAGDETMDPPVGLPAGDDVKATAAWIAAALDRPDDIPAPLRRQAAAIARYR